MYSFYSCVHLEITGVLLRSPSTEYFAKFNSVVMKAIKNPEAFFVSSTCFHVPKFPPHEYPWYYAYTEGKYFRFLGTHRINKKNHILGTVHNYTNKQSAAIHHP